jgi:hypothetical protein
MIDTDFWPFWSVPLLLTFAFILGCLVGWSAQYDAARTRACASICAPRIGIDREGRCFCAVEAQP